MSIEPGQKLPQADLLISREDEAESASTDSLFGSGRHVVFAMPGAFTSTCSALHLPNVVKHAGALKARGADSVSVLVVNDATVTAVWGAANGAYDAGVQMLADPVSAFSTAMGLTFTLPAKGYYDRSKRYSLLVEDGVVTRLNLEEPGGGCDISGGEVILDQLG